MKTKKYDVIVYGATSFVGQLICQYLVAEFSDSQLNWAMAARSEDKLLSVKSELGEKAKYVPIILANSHDLDSLKNLCLQTKVVASTVGPYDLYGEPLIQACVDTGTDYCDLTGEPHWIKKMLNQYEDAAKTSGARIVHCVGFDSIPSDLGVYHLQKEAQRLFGTVCEKVNLRIKNMKGAASGGTIATALNMAKELKANPDMRKDLINPYSLCPSEHQFRMRQKNIKVLFDDSFGCWVGPFFMSSINTKIVHRSNALSDNSYGKNFLYSEGVCTGKGFKGKLKAKALYWGLASFFLGAGIRPIRAFLGRFVLPKPGEGPNAVDRENGFYDFRFEGITAQGQSINTKVYGDMDPGYGSTAKIMSQACVCMAFDINNSVKGGFWTPATLMGEKLIDRLNKYSGLEFKVINSSESKN